MGRSGEGRRHRAGIGLPPGVIARHNRAMCATPFTLDTLATPLGTALIVSDAQGRLRFLDWQDNATRLHRLATRQYPGLPEFVPGRAPALLHGGLNAYFAGQCDAITALPYEFGGTAFQRRVWHALRAIPAGETLSYGALTQRLGLSPGSARAIGHANGANPISLVIPCHRLVGADGALTGYADGLPRKQWLLAHETKHSRQNNHSKLREPKIGIYKSLMMCFLMYAFI